ncbi:MAG: pyridoxine 5'-phosphate synthase [bacterium]
MIRLGVNIDHIATLRQQRLGTCPNLLDAARMVKEAGAQGITMHLREDRRHIQEKDVLDIGTQVRIDLNLEMAATKAMVNFACKRKPHQICMVPEKRQELTTEGGLDVVGQGKKLTSYIKKLKKAGIKVSLFIDPVIEQIRAAHQAGAHAVELHTGTYVNTPGQKELKDLEISAEIAYHLGLKVHAGHGIDYTNVKTLVRLPHLEELNIGFSIVSRALFIGLEKAVGEMLALLKT